MDLNNLLKAVENSNVDDNNKEAPMKQQLHTFPIWEQFESKSECPFCEILEETEESYISGMFRDMTMDQEFINFLKNNSFCSTHFARLMKYRDKFGLALLLSQLLDYEIANLKTMNIRKYIPPVSSKGPFQKFLAKFISPASTKSYEDSHDKPIENRCALCQYLEEREQDFMEILIQLWEDNLHFRALYYNSKGFCLEHFYTLVEHAPRILKEQELDNFLDTSFEIQFQSMKELNQDLKWFIKKFNYEYSNKPWNNSRDSLARSILKIKKERSYTFYRIFLFYGLIFYISFFRKLTASTISFSGFSPTSLSMVKNPV